MFSGPGAANALKMKLNFWKLAIMAIGCANGASRRKDA
jgi:hypothetical protein